MKQTHHPKEGTKPLFALFLEIASKHLFCLPLLPLYQLSGKKSFYPSLFLLPTSPCQGPVISFPNSLVKLLVNRRSWGRVFRSSGPSGLVYKKEVMSMSGPSWSSPNRTASPRPSPVFNYAVSLLSTVFYFSNLINTSSLGSR